MGLENIDWAYVIATGAIIATVLIGIEIWARDILEQQSVNDKDK